MSIAKQVPEMKGTLQGQPGCWGSRWARPATAPRGALSPSRLQSWEGAGSAPLQLPGCGVRDRHRAGGGELLTPAEPQDHAGTGRERSVGPWDPRLSGALAVPGPHLSPLCRAPGSQDPTLLPDPWGPRMPLPKPRGPTTAGYKPQNHQKCFRDAGQQLLCAAQGVSRETTSHHQCVLTWCISGLSLLL